MTVLPAAKTDLRRIGVHPDYWYPLAWSYELKRGKPMARHFAGEPVVLYRGESGKVHALEDRCAHRQVPLSMGIIEGDTLKCGYHGWTYDCAGHCTNIPYLGRERLPNGVTAYPTAEIDGMIFIFPGDPAKAEERRPASLGSNADKSYKTRRLDRSVACHYSFMYENLSDMNHQVLHRSLMGSIKATCLGRRTGPDWCEVDYTFTRTEGRATFGESTILGIVRAPEDAANRDTMTIRTEYPYQRLKVWVGPGDPVLDVWLAYTPLDAAQRTNRTFGYLSVKKPKIPGVIHLAWPFVTWFTEGIFTQDKHIVEEEQKAHDLQGDDWNNEVFQPVRDVRDVLARCGAPITRHDEKRVAAGGTNTR